MCGIAGVFSKSQGAEQQKNLCEKMLQSIQHRGPDHSEIWQHPNGISLGHNRLSIIDLSDLANQPFHFEHLSVVFNGELYNYIEVRNELISIGHSFYTQSDTEVLLHAYLEWGSKCLEKFVGMWAIVIYDSRTDTLFASRDRFGIKPLYYIWHQNSFYFASEYKALKLLLSFDSKLNIPHLYRYIQMGIVDYQDQTFWECIRHLPAAHNLTIINNQIAVERYWDIEIKDLNLSDSDTIVMFRQKIIESVSLHMRSDVAVGGCLSGGIDSSTIASIIGKYHSGAPFNTYTIFYDGVGEVDERPFAREVIKSYTNLKPYYYSPSDIDVADAFDTIQYHQDIPLPGSSPISQFFVMKLAKSHGAIVLLDGQGSDEYLAGYLHSFYRHIADGLFSANPFEGLQRWGAFTKIQQFGVKEQFTRLAKSLATGILGENEVYYREYLHAHPFLPLDSQRAFELNKLDSNRLNQFLYNLLFTTSLPTLLHFEDRNSMAFSIESRVPFLDHRLVEFAFSLSNQFKIKGGVTKHVLRESMRGILPDAIINRMDKKGFVTPGEVKWLRGPLRFLVEDIDYSNLHMLDVKKVRQLVDSYKKGDNTNAGLVWRVATLSRWLKS